VDVEIVGHILTPSTVEPSDDRVKNLKLPSGFRVQKFATDLGKPRMLAISEDGSAYVTRPQEGDCLLLADTDGDGRADRKTVVAKRDKLHGIAIHENRVYLATVKEVLAADRKPDGTLGELKQIGEDLPDGGQHPNRTLGIGPDGMLYVSVGSTCNSCVETNEEHATILRMSLDGGKREIFAKGLRNTVGFAWHPQTGQLWGVDHNIDWLGDEVHDEELNLLEQGANYGWPFLFGKGEWNPGSAPPGNKTREEVAQESRGAVLQYTAHAAPMQMAFYSGSQFPSDYRNNAFVAMRGSWNRKPPAGYEVARIRFQDGKPVAFEPFLTGFLMQNGKKWNVIGRPVGIAIGRDGALLVSDDTNGVIYQISHASGEASIF
jgi:glucose/arabinose dehydrogenase